MKFLSGKKQNSNKIKGLIIITNSPFYSTKTSDSETCLKMSDEATLSDLCFIFVTHEIYGDT